MTLLNKKCLQFGEKNELNLSHGVLITPWPNPINYSLIMLKLILIRNLKEIKFMIKLDIDIEPKLPYTFKPWEINKQQI